MASWSFQGQPATVGRQRLHPYPAQLHYLLVDALLDRYAVDEDVIYDPFCGSGTTLVEASVRGFEAVGTDINPLAVLIARAKVAPCDPDKLLSECKRLQTALTETAPLFNKGRRPEIPPTITNLEHWYTPLVIEGLGQLRSVIRQHKNRLQYKDFFLAAFAYTCRQLSLTRKGEFKRVRVQADKIPKQKTDVALFFLNHLKAMYDIFSGIEAPMPRRKKTKVVLHNIQQEPISHISGYDLALFSPPYGDSRTTAAYGQHSSFGLEWLVGLDPMFNKKWSEIDNESLASNDPPDEEMRFFPQLMTTLDKIGSKDPQRGREVLRFFVGYHQALKNIVEELYYEGRLIAIVGNRTVRDIPIPMDQITCEMLSAMDMSFKGIYVRGILNKSQSTNTMNHEYVVVFDAP